MNFSRLIGIGNLFLAIAAGLVALIASALLLLPLARAGLVREDANPDNAALAFAAAAGCLSVAATAIVSYCLHRRSLKTYDRISRTVFDAARAGIIVLDENNRYFSMNGMAESILGLNRDEAFGVDAGSLASGNAECATYAGREYSVDSCEVDLRRAGGPGRIVFLRDVTRQRTAETTLKKIFGAIASLQAHTSRISDASFTLSQGAAEQASSLSAITASLGEINAKSQGSSDAASHGTQIAVKAREAAERSGSEIANALTAMTDVQEAGIRIARIVKFIDDIAFQTTLLALNAAVEAARAGAQGKGFAVVAGEVRNLSGRSAKAAKDTAAMVEDVTERIGNAGTFINRLEEMLKNIVEDAIGMADSTASATAASLEQAEGIQKVDQELRQLDSMTQNTMNAAENAAVTARELANQVADIRALVDSIAGEILLEERKTPRTSVLAGRAPGETRMGDDGYSRILDFPRGAGNERRRKDDSFGRNDWSAESWRRPNGGDPNVSRPEPVRGGDKRYGPGNGDSAFDTDDVGWVRAGSPDRRNAGALSASPENDAQVVPPTQKIILDDSEFGRY
ncbi:MAG: methyl-accepting chemotaxis protein [Planctomycetota bacterium]|jgi:PAS domain-containing protein|nr:methyl-accepting chemotaxis protein [Planctomycetota bacterium]